MIAMRWHEHDEVFDQIVGADAPVTAANIVFLALIATLPFTSDLLGRCGGEALATALYAANIAALTACLLRIQFAADRRDLRRAGASSIGGYDLLVPLACFTISIPIAFVNPTVAKSVWAVSLAAEPIELFTTRPLHHPPHRERGRDNTGLTQLTPSTPGVAVHNTSGVRTVTIHTRLDAPADVVWNAVNTPHAFVHVTRGMLRYPAAERWNRPWQVGDHVQGWTFLFGVLPFSYHHITVASIDDDARVLASDEHGGVVRTWRHDMTVTPIDDTSCRYDDRIDIDAGVLTPMVAAYAHVFYHYRQRRWRSLARLLAATTR